MTEDMRETMERVALDDFYEARGETCMCCPGGISKRNIECMKWRKKNLFNRNAHLGSWDTSKTPPKWMASQGGRYPVSEKFPCEKCGKVEFHIHDR